MCREVVTQGGLLFVVLYRILLLTFAEAMREEAPRFLQLCYRDYKHMVGPMDRSARLLHALMLKSHYIGSFRGRRRAGMSRGGG